MVTVNIVHNYEDNYSVYINGYLCEDVGDED